MIVILGSGIAGLSLSYFLSSSGIKNLVIEKEDFVGKKRDTSLISKKIGRFFELENFVEKEHKIANFYYKDELAFSVKSKNKMVVINRNSFEKYIFENIDKNFSKFSFNTFAKGLKNNLVITNKGNFEFEILVDALGPYSLLNENKKIAIGIEAIVRGKIMENVNIFFDNNFSKNYFGWIVDVNNYTKIGLMDYNLKLETFWNFLKKFNLKEVKEFYAYPINTSIAKKLCNKNYLIVGEASGYIKPFSLGGITFSVFSAFLAYKYIKRGEIEKYEKAMKKVFWKSIKIGKILKRLFHTFNIKVFKPLAPLAKFLDPDFLY